MPANANPSPAEIVTALQRGGIVEALKLVLAAKGIGSSGEKSVAGQVGSRSRPFGSSPPSSKVTDLSPGEVPRSSGDVWLLLLVMAALCIAYYFFAR
jgi:hypothetical protein